MGDKLLLEYGQYVDDVPTNIGKAYGYRVLTSSFMRSIHGLIETSADAADCLHFVPAYLFMPRPGKRNWLYTMHEMEDVPQKYIDGLKRADHVIVPTRWNREIFAPHIPEKPIHVIPPPIDPVFTYKVRKAPEQGAKFRLLYVGAASKRKGAEELKYVWQSVFSKMPEVELYIKTTNSKSGGCFREGNVIRDDRDFSKIELRDLYHSADCLLSPSRGEAFNLVLAEAMATGMPCIATNYGGPTDYFDESNGYPVNFFMVEQDGEFIGRKDLAGQKMNIACPEVGHLVDRIIEVYRNYDDALERGRFGAETVKREFAWATAGRALVETIQR